MDYAEIRDLGNSHERNSKRLSVRLLEWIFHSRGYLSEGEFYAGILSRAGPLLCLSGPLDPRFATASALRSGDSRRFRLVFLD